MIVNTQMIFVTKSAFVFSNQAQHDLTGLRALYRFIPTVNTHDMKD